MEKKDIGEKTKSLEEEINNVINQITSLDIRSLPELKTFNQPPVSIKITLQCVCVLFDKEPTWEESKKLISNRQFISIIRNFDRDNIGKQKIDKLQKILDSNPAMTPETVKKTSIAAGYLFSWVIGLYEYSKHTSNQMKKQAEDKVFEKDLKETVQKLNEEEKLNDAPKIQDQKNEKGKEKEIEVDADTKALLQRAEEALCCLNKSVFAEVRSIVKPHSMIALTLYLVGVLLDNKTKNIIGQSDYNWKDSKQMVSNPNEFLERLKSFKPENISEEVMQEVRKIIEANSGFTEEGLSKISKAGSMFFRWVQAVCNYYDTIKALKIKQLQLIQK